MACPFLCLTIQASNHNFISNVASIILYKERMHQIWKAGPRCRSRSSSPKSYTAVCPCRCWHLDSDRRCCMSVRIITSSPQNYEGRNMDPTFPLVPIANFIACLLVLSSLSKSMFQSWNVGACSFAIWIALESLIRAINSIIWARSVENRAPVWCDISMSIMALSRMIHLTLSAQSYTHRHRCPCSRTCRIFRDNPKALAYNQEK